MLTFSSVSSGTVLGTFFLLVTALNAQNGNWDNPTCTEGTIFVSRGKHAMMACNISNTFTHITIQLSAQGKKKTIFSEDGPGHFSRDGWQLQVQGGQAQLVIEAAQDSHAGQYLWRLHGLQACNKITTLNVSESQDQEELSGPRQAVVSKGPKPLPLGSEASFWSLVRAVVTGVFSILVVGTLN